VSCGITKKADAEAIVLSVVRAENPGITVTLNTEFDRDLGEDGIARRRYFVPMRNRFKDQGCRFKSLSSNHMSRFKERTIVNVRDLAEVAFGDRASL